MSPSKIGLWFRNVDDETIHDIDKYKDCVKLTIEALITLKSIPEFGKKGV